MKSPRTILFIAIISILVAQSCKKEEYLTSAEQQTVELKNFIKDKNITWSSIYEYSSSGSWYSIGEGKIVINECSIYFKEYYYPIDRLYKYSYYYDTNENRDCIVLYFK